MNINIPSSSILRLYIFTTIFFLFLPAGAEAHKKNDVHYNEMGFFDVHICNWPNRNPFILAVFSTYRFEDIKSVTIFRPDGSELGKLNLSRYRLIQKKGKPEKRAFLTEFELSTSEKTGWYSATAELNTGKQFKARDLVQIRQLGMSQAVFPADKQKLAKPPTYLEWQAVPGAKFYKLYIRDMWEGGKLILETKLLKSNRYELPRGLIQQGGLYSWKVNARDANEDPQLGDFNSGSLTKYAEFSVE